MVITVQLSSTFFIPALVQRDWSPSARLSPFSDHARFPANPGPSHISLKLVSSINSAGVLRIGVPVLPRMPVLNPRVLDFGNGESILDGPATMTPACRS